MQHKPEYRQTIVIASAFILITLFGLYTTSVTALQIAVVAIVCALAVSTRAITCALPYVLYSPLAAMAQLPLFAILSGLLISHLFVSAMTRSLKIEFSPTSRQLVPLFVGVLLVVLTSTIVNENVSAAWPGLSAYFLAGTFLIVLGHVAHSRKEIYFLVNICIASAAGFVYKAVVFASENPPALLLLGAPDDSDWQARTTFYLENEFVKRFLWIGQDPNYTAALHFLPLGVCLLLLMRAPRFRILFGLCAALNLAQILGTLSRTGALLAFAMILIVVVQGKLKRSHMLILLMALSGLAALAYSQMDYVLDRLSTVQSSVEGDGASGRFAYWQHAESLLVSRPFLGFGPGGFQREVGDAAHNTFIETYVDLGLLGGTAFLGLVVWPLALSIKGRLYTIVRNPAVTGYLFYLFMGLSISYYQIFIIIMMGQICLMSSRAVLSQPESRRRVIPGLPLHRRQPN